MHECLFLDAQDQSVIGSPLNRLQEAAVHH